jgi:hypothetical protein
MPTNMNLLIDLKGYEGNQTNVCRAKFVKNVQYIGVELSNETIQEVTVEASSSKTLFSVLTADAKKFIYLEATAECDITVNGVAESTIKPVIIGDSVKSGIFFKTTDLESVEITNNGTEDIQVFYITSK